MKKFAALFAFVALFGMAACTSVSSQPAPSDQPEQPAGQSEQTPAPKVPTKPGTPVTPGLSAAATRAQAANTKPVAPGVRVSRVQVNGMYVALTFDDGPSPSLTPKVLDILGRHGAHGTFFVLGQNADRNKSIISRAAAEGHEVGVHTWSHIKMSSAALPKIDSEISRTISVISEATGKTPHVMRPPYGATNKSLIAHMYNQYGLSTILWDVDTLDWKHPGVQKVINTAVGQAKPGSIILVHDIHASTLAALEGIVTGLQARGFKLVTVSELMSIARKASGGAAPKAPVAAPVAPVAPEAPAASETPASAPETPVVPVAPLAPLPTEAPAAADAPVVSVSTPAAEAPAAEQAPAEL